MLTRILTAVRISKSGSGIRPCTDDRSCLFDQLFRPAAARVHLGCNQFDGIEQFAAVPWTVLADPEGNEFCVLTPL